MRQLLNTLFVLTEDAYLTLENETVCVKVNDELIGRVPLISLESVLCFSYRGASPALMGACAERGINLAFIKPGGRFLARVNGISRGNILLRKTQYRISDNETESCSIARNMIFGKIYNARQTVARTRRDHALRVDCDKLRRVEEGLRICMDTVRSSKNLDSLRGTEGEAAALYFGVFNDMILNSKEEYCFESRTRRPPTDRVNAMLSFAYSLLTNDCASALESVGLDAYAGFMHRDRPGRKSLALDLMEELRPFYADRFVLTLINNRMINPEQFEFRENSSVHMSDSARRIFLREWQARKQEKILHPYLREKLPWGVIPYVQALLLARYLRGDIDGYPPFLWK